MESSWADVMSAGLSLLKSADEVVEATPNLSECSH